MGAFAVKVFKAIYGVLLEHEINVNKVFRVHCEI